jgi:Icc protein
MTTVLHITDTHIVERGKLVSKLLDTSDSLTRLVTRINSIRDQVGPIDAVLVSGDVSDDGSEQSYEQFKKIVAPLDLPLYVIPGNHDRRENMRSAFSENMPVDGPLNWDLRVGDVVIIGLDTLVEGKGLGTLLPQSIDFLEQALARADHSPVLLALHHPPFTSHVDFMDKIALTNPAAMNDLISGYGGNLRMVCGHIHSMMISDVSGRVAISAPSPCSAFAFDQRLDAPVGFMNQEDGCLLHRWNNGFQSIRIPPIAGTGPFAF